VIDYLLDYFTVLRRMWVLCLLFSFSFPFFSLFAGHFSALIRSPLTPPRPHSHHSILIPILTPILLILASSLAFCAHHPIRDGVFKFARAAVDAVWEEMMLELGRRFGPGREIGAGAGVGGDVAGGGDGKTERAR
jgi:hypothetical protein